MQERKTHNEIQTVEQVKIFTKENVLQVLIVAHRDGLKDVEEAALDFIASDKVRNMDDARWLINN